MENLEKIIKIFKKDGKIIIKKKNDKNFLIIFKNQNFSCIIDPKSITIKGKANNNFNETAQKAEEIKNILKKIINSEIIIEIS
jgi:hypothetical protein